jgi:hypothetical protein
MLRQLHLICLLLIIVLASVACSSANKPCLKYSRITAGLTFKTQVDTLLRDTTLPDLIITYPALLTAYRFKNLNRVEVDLNTNNGITVLQFSEDSTSASFDEATIYSSKKLNFISKECGYNFFSTIDSVQYSTNLIKKITIPNKTVDDNTNKVNLTIIF